MTSCWVTHCRCESNGVDLFVEKVAQRLQSPYINLVEVRGVPEYACAGAKLWHLGCRGLDGIGSSGVYSRGLA